MESTLVFPVALLMTVVLLFTVLWIYRSSFLYGTSAIEAQRASFAWNDSGRDAATGRINSRTDDGLYWRIGSGLLHAGFGLFGGGGASMRAPNPPQPSNLTEKKLARSAKMLPSGMTGEVIYKSSGWRSQVTVELKDVFIMPVGGSKLAASSASSYISEPVEWIRLIDLTRTYFGEIKNRITLGRAKSLFQEPGSDSEGETIRFTNEREAAAYLRKLVSGTEREFVTSSGQRRLVDALDGSGIAHQAYFTFSESQLRNEQLPKDLDLLRSNGAVRGVVWHFFNSGKYTPSASFKAELERSGIIVVVHQ